jgi:predicted phosphodiesterase
MITRVAALYDVHGNLPALRAVLGEVEREAIDLLVFGGDIAGGPMPRETLECMQPFAPRRARFIRGNGDRETVDAFDQGRRDVEREVGMSDRIDAFVASQITTDQRDFLAAFEPTVTIDIDGLGPTCFCHGTPASDTAMITTATTDERLEEIVSTTLEPLVVCGHTHRQFDRTVGSHRIVNAGSVGLPYEGSAAAYWAVIGPEVSLRRTEYDLPSALEEMRRPGCPDLEEFLGGSLIDPIDPDDVAAQLEAMGADG